MSRPWRLYHNYLESQNGQSAREHEELAFAMITEPTVDCSLGFSHDDDSLFVPLGSNRNHEEESFDPVRQNHWQRLAAKITKTDYWSRLAFYGLGLRSLPADIIVLWDRVETETGVQIGKEERLSYFKEFARAALGTSSIHFTDCEAVLSKMGLSSHLTRAEMETLMHSRLDSSRQSSASPENDEFFDFEHFALLICDLLITKAELEEASAIQESWLDNFPLDPESKPKRVWDTIIMGLLLYSSFAVPFSVAFNYKPPSTEGGSISSAEIFDYLIDFIFLSDIVVTFLTAHDSQGYLVREFREIARLYAKGWLFPDFAGSFPFDKVVALSLSASGSSVSNSTLRIIGLVRMLRLIRAMKLLSRLGRLKKQDGLERFSTIISLVSTSFLLIFSAHLLGCIFTMLILDQNSNWLFRYRPDLMNADIGTRYVVALYWAMITISTMGYGDIVPDNHLERCYVILVSIIGAVLFSYCLGTISSLITQVSGVDDRFQEKGRAVLEYIRFREISGTMKRKIKTFFLRCWQSSSNPYQEHEILDDLDSTLRCGVLRQIGAKFCGELPILQGFDDECVGFIALRMKRTMFYEGDIVYRRGDRARDMYFIVKGKLVLRSDEMAGLRSDNDVPKRKASVETPKRRASIQMAPSRPERLVGDGEIFGELALFPDILGRSRIDTAIASSTVTAFALSVHDIPLLREEYPRFVQRLRELCELQAVQLKLDGGSALLDRGERATRPCKLKAHINHIKSDLIRIQEAKVLKPSAGNNASEVFKVYRPMSPLTKGVEVEWQSMSCMLSENGEILLISHDCQGLADDKPHSLGFLVPHHSAFRALEQQETFLYGGTIRNELFGCKVTVLPSYEAAINHRRFLNNKLYAEGEGLATIHNIHFSDLSSVMLFTWSHDVFDTMTEAIQAYLKQENEDRGTEINHSAHDPISSSGEINESDVSLQKGDRTQKEALGNLGSNSNRKGEDRILSENSKEERLTGLKPQEFTELQRDVRELKHQVVRLAESLDKLNSSLEVKQSPCDHDRMSALQEQLLNVSEALLRGIGSGAIEFVNGRSKAEEQTLMKARKPVEHSSTHSSNSNAKDSATLSIVRETHTDQPAANVPEAAHLGIMPAEAPYPHGKSSTPRSQDDSDRRKSQHISGTNELNRKQTTAVTNGHQFENYRTARSEHDDEQAASEEILLQQATERLSRQLEGQRLRLPLPEEDGITLGVSGPRPEPTKLASARSRGRELSARKGLYAGSVEDPCLDSKRDYNPR